MEKFNVSFRGKDYKVAPLSTVLEFLTENQLQIKHPVAAVLNGHLTRVDRKIKVDSTLEIIQLESYMGQKIYESSLVFLFVTAFQKKFPTKQVRIQHAIPGGVYAEIVGEEAVKEDVKEVADLMKKMSSDSLPIGLIKEDWDLCLRIMKESGRDDLVDLYRYYAPTEMDLYELDGYKEPFYLPLITNTKFLKDFDLKRYQDGIAILVPDFDKKDKPMSELDHIPKLFGTYTEFKEWGHILQINSVGQLNHYVMNEDIGNLIKVTEALHEKKIAQIADQISKQEYVPRLVLIAGPSSSGKTTFSKRLEVQLRVNGFTPVAVSLDNYFVERDKTPRDEFGNYDFESVDAIDVPLFSYQLASLLKGEEVTLPIFDFKTGTRHLTGKKMKLLPNQIMIVEGIHGLNPKLSGGIEDKDKFKIYISPLTQLNLHHHDRVPSTDTRLIRRIVRDSFFRGYSAADTLKQWKSVRHGESKNIFPFQEEANIIFNSAMFYELSILKPYAERELLKVHRNHPMYPDAQRLLKFLSFFLPLEPDDVPQTSILREFVGGSTFKY